MKNTTKLSADRKSIPAYKGKKMDKALLAIVALGLGFFLWEIHGEVKDLKANIELARKMDENKKTPILQASPSLSAPEQKPCIVHVVPVAPSKKVLPAPLNLPRSLAK